MVLQVVSFCNKAVIKDVPQSGEFVHWLQQNDMAFDTIKLVGTKEVGTVLAYESTLKENVCRPFNSIEEVNGKIVKKELPHKVKNLLLMKKIGTEK